MTDSYDHKGVTITPQPGGFYELTHPSLTEPLRERGKEKAEQRADEIAAANPGTDSESFIPPQGNIPEAPPAIQPAQPAAQEPGELKQVLEQMAEMQARLEELAAAGVRTVAVEPGAESPDVTAGAPPAYSGQMDEAVRKLLESQGHKVVKIILEENENIPPTGLFVGHNGRAYMIQPGVPVDVPDFLVGILDNAVTSAPIVDTTTKKVLGYRDRLKYPYRRVE
jgi:hypothetical protein